MTVSVTMLQTRRGEDGSLWTAGTQHDATDAFAAVLITANLATGTLPRTPSSAPLRPVYDTAGNLIGAVDAAGNLLSAGGSGNELTASTIANLPSAAANAGKFLYCTDYGPAGCMLRSNGTRWRPFSGMALLHQTTSATAISGTSEQKAAGFQLPPGGLIQPGDRLRMRLTFSKSGLTDSGTIGIAMGTNVDIISDADLVGPTAYLAAANRSGGSLVDFCFTLATATQKLGGASVFATSFGGASATALPAAVTGLPDITSATPVYLGVTMLMGGTTDSMTLVDWTVELLCGAG